MKQVVSANIGGKTITLESGRLAKQADGSVLASCGNNMVLVTAVSSSKESHLDFFPLTVEYQEKFYSTGKIPGGYFKREGRPTTNATLTARLLDRPIRPCFPEGYRHETQIVATVLSYDGTFPLETLASVGASAALVTSDIPFNGPTALVTVGRVGGQMVLNPSPLQKEQSDLDIAVAGTVNGLLMVEGETKFASEADALAALKFGHDGIKQLLSLQNQLVEKVGRKEHRKFKVFTPDEAFKKKDRKSVV